MTSNIFGRILSLGIILLFSLPLHATELQGEMLAEEKKCNACHSMNEVLIGPPYIAISARHASQKDIMVDVLARKIVEGGGGTWGVVPMVPNEHVSDAEAQRLASWILSN